MKKIFLFFILLSPLFLVACSNNQEKTALNEAKPALAEEEKVNYGEVSISPSEVEKIQIFLFHATQRCRTCIAIGKLSGEMVNERFLGELSSGKIEFREINIDLPENKALAKKFRVSGSALYINTIANGEENISQDTKVWQLTNNPSDFKDYLGGKISNLLGK